MRSVVLDNHSVWSIITDEQTQFRKAITNKNTFWVSKCPYGQIDETIFVKEQWCLYKNKPMYRSTINAETKGYKYCDWKSANTMPEEYARLFLKIKGVGIERLQDITKDDCINCGIAPNYSFDSFIERYKDLWDFYCRKHKKGHFWHTNPLVWVVKFNIERFKYE